MCEENDYLMAWLLAIICLVFIVVLYLLFAPFYLEIDTEKNLLRLRFHRFAYVRLLIENSSLKLHINIAVWNKKIDLLRQPVHENKKVSPTRIKPARKAQKISLKKVIAVLKTFKVNKCAVNMDFGDIQWNAILFPLFFWMSRMTGKHIQVNFTGKNNVKLEIQNNFARIIFAFLYN
jgi:hypothetical protein